MSNLSLSSTIDIAIIGLGATGYACVRYFVQRGYRVFVTDNRAHPPYLDLLRQHYPEVPVDCGAFSVDKALSANRIMLSQGISTDDPSIQRLIQSSVPVVSDIELFATITQKPIIAITGSNGKSTVTSLVSAMVNAAGLDVHTGGNLGPPALDLIADPEPSGYILELSNFQLERTQSLKAQVACILNLSPDHLDRYSDYQAYIDAKQRIYHQAHIAVINRDDPKTFPQTEQPHRILSFGLDEPADGLFGLSRVNGQLMMMLGDKPLLPTSLLALPGKLGIQNSLAALAIGFAYGLPLAPMLQTLKTFKGLPHRCQLVRIRNHVHYINDSKGTNVGATLAALESVGQFITGKIVWLAGGEGKGADFSDLSCFARRYVRQAILFGRDAARLADALSPDVPVLHVADLKTAVEKADELAMPGDAVLLSPACASFDMFKNFQHRGDVFMDYIGELPE